MTGVSGCPLDFFANLNIHLAVSGFALYQCQNGGGNTAPGVVVTAGEQLVRGPQAVACALVNISISPPGGPGVVAVTLVAITTASARRGNGGPCLRWRQA